MPWYYIVTIISVCLYIFFTVADKFVQKKKAKLIAAKKEACLNGSNYSNDDTTSN